MRLIALLLLATGLVAEEGWWMTTPLRWIQTNFRQTDAALDPKRLVDTAAEYQANVLHIGMGGIAAYYPTKVKYHFASPHIPPGRDPFGEVLREAHARGIRVVGRFDLSKVREDSFRDHPEWLFRKADGQPVVYNGLYSVCINGGYYTQKGMEILEEALTNYDVDGLFFNMFGNSARDYSGNLVGHCHCDTCKRLYREWYKKELPKQPDDDYRQFMFRSSRMRAAAIGDLIHRIRPKAGYFNYIQESTDGIMSESNTAVNRPLPLWPYTSSDNVNRGRNSEPSKMSVNLNMQFVDFPWRFATVPRQEIALRAWQNLSHGGALTLAINGTFDQQDRQALTTMKPIFQWAAANEQYFGGQQSAARVLLLGMPGRTGREYSQAAYRGLFRFLTEEHIPFAVSDNVEWVGKREFDLVIASDWAPAELERYAAQGGRVLIVSPRVPEFPVAKVVKTWPKQEAYIRVRNHKRFPSLELTNLLMLQGDYTEIEGDGSDSLSYVPPSMYGPPEFIHIDIRDTAKPGIVVTEKGKGRVAWLPWDVAGMYYRLSLPAHGGVLRDAVNELLPQRQLRTNAHPLVEMSLMRQRNRTLLHVVNLSGHSQTGYFAPVPMLQIEFSAQGSFGKARAVRSGAALPVKREGNMTKVVLPRLDDYELIVLEQAN